MLSYLKGRLRARWRRWRGINETVNLVDNIRELEERIISATRYTLMILFSSLPQKGDGGRGGRGGGGGLFTFFFT